MTFITAPLTLLLAACGDTAKLPEQAGFGTNPTLPPPNSTLIPTVKIAPAKGWPDGVKPAATSGLAVNAYATGLDHPRWLYVLPNGDVLVAETNAPERPERGGPKMWIMSQVQKRAGAGVPSANRISLLRDADGDGVAETRTVFLQGLNSPFGMALVGNDLYVANTDAVMRFPYAEGETQISKPGSKVAELPGGPLNHHWTKNLSPARTARGSMWRSVRTAMSARTASTRRNDAPRFSRSILPPERREHSHRDCAIPSECRGIRKPACCGRW